MEENYGVERGSYIWGRQVFIISTIYFYNNSSSSYRSVHNVRIERLWRDVTQGFGLKWYNFFYALEAESGLSPDNDGHIWLIHYLFLPSITQDAHDWAGAWNAHRLRLSNEIDRSPNDMFFFGVLQNGLRGPQGVADATNLMTHLEEDIENLATYGVDWHDLADPAILHHHNEHNPNEVEDIENLYPRNTRQPEHLSLVEIPAFHCPFPSSEQLELFDESLLAMPEYYSRGMEDRKTLWIQALDLLLTLLPIS